MTSTSYSYGDREGVLPISWEDVHRLCRGLAVAASRYCPELILAVGRGGYYPGTLLSHLLQKEIFPIRLSRRVNDVVTFEHPRWLVSPPAGVANKRVLIVDDICDSGETLRMIRSSVADLGAVEVQSAVLYAHTHAADVPDYIGLCSDALIINPWDRQILADGQLRVHPEYAEALSAQGMPLDGSLVDNRPPGPIAKPAAS